MSRSLGCGGKRVRGEIQLFSYCCWPRDGSRETCHSVDPQIVRREVIAWHATTSARAITDLSTPVTPRRVLPVSLLSGALLLRIVLQPGPQAAAARRRRPASFSASCMLKASKHSNLLHGATFTTTTRFISLLGRLMFRACSSSGSTGGISCAELSFWGWQCGIGGMLV